MIMHGLLDYGYADVARNWPVRRSIWFISAMR